MLFRFLLARLYLNLLLDEKNEKRIRNLAQKLKSGSEAYDHAYNETMKRIENQTQFSQDLAKRVLSWVTFSRRPLTTTELQNAVAVEIGETEFDETNITDIEELSSVCSGLIVIQEKSQTVKLVHFTAQNYLERTLASWFPGVHEVITDTCVTYLSFDVFDTPSPIGAYSQAQETNYPFYRYSARELRSHLRQSQGNELLLSAFFKNDTKVSRYMREMFGLSQSQGAFSGLHLAALIGLKHIVEGLLLTGETDVNVCDYLNRTPLIWASVSGNEAIVKLLLSYGANVDCATKDGFTSLFYATEYGHTAIARLLIEAGANVDFCGRDNWTPLLLAARGGGEIRSGLRTLVETGDRGQVIKLLLDAGASVDLANNRQETPLFTAAENGHEEAVRLLLERNADPNSQNLEGITPIFVAARKGYTNIIELLLGIGKEEGDSVSGSINPSPFVNTSSNESKQGLDEDDNSSVAFLQGSGDASLQDEFGRLPLHWAASRGDSDLVEDILRHGCDPNPKDIFGRTPLFAAVSLARVNVAKALLDHPGIEAHSRDRLGVTPLYELYKRKQSHIEGPWGEITELLGDKIGIDVPDLPRAEDDLFKPFGYPQRWLDKKCDVCLDTHGIQNGDTPQCEHCSSVVKKDGTSGWLVTYCQICIQGRKRCPLCDQSLSYG